jgi:hypothetical protein
MSESEMQAELERLRTENAQLKIKDKGGLSLKVSEKGRVSLYGMGRFPSRSTKNNGSASWRVRRRSRRSSAKNDSKLKTKE